MTGVSLGFECEWFDAIANDLQKLYLKFRVDDGTLELMQDGGKTFLKRIHYPAVTLQDLFLENSVTIFNRVITIKKYANSFTRDYLQTKEQHFLYFVANGEKDKLGQVLSIARRNNFRFGRIRTANVDYIGLGRGGFAIEFVRISEGSSSQAFLKELDNIGMKDACAEATASEIGEIMDNFRGINIAENSTLCLIKPHLVKEVRVDELINIITSNGFNVEAMFSIHLNLSMAEELLDVYRGVHFNYNKMIEHVCSGPIIALMITSGSENVVGEFRELCGPLEPELAKILRPKSIRAILGKTLTENAVHCTDLPTDGQLECRYLFETLANL